MEEPQTGDPSQRLGAFVHAAYHRAPAIRHLFDDAGLRPEDVRSVDDLARIPVTSKDRLMRLQREEPPFGGFLAADPKELRHIFVSPGPVFDPQTERQRGLRFQYGFAAAGIGPGDVVLNTWSYHLVPAGLVFDEALTEIGATVIPGGVGNSEQQAKLILDLNVTVVVASTGFFLTLVDKLEQLGHQLPDDWGVRIAFLGGEFGDWMAKRRAIQERLGVRTASAYGTADLGLVGYECEANAGYHVIPETIVQICDPASGDRLPDGEVGEIVATTFNDDYPLIRLGTGDLSHLIQDPCPCGNPAPRLAPLQGRVGLAVKAREIFIYPLHVTTLVSRVGAVSRAQVVVHRPDAVEKTKLRIELAPATSDPESVRRRVFDEFQSITRLSLDDLDIVPDGSITLDDPLVVDKKDN